MGSPRDLENQEIAEMRTTLGHHPADRQYNTAQNITREIVTGITSMTPVAGILIPFLPEVIPSPWDGALKAGAPGVVYWVGSVFRELSNKVNPMAELRAHGYGDAGLGVMRITLTSLPSVTFVALVGIGAKQLSDMKFSHGNSTNCTDVNSTEFDNLYEFDVNNSTNSTGYSLTLPQEVAIINNSLVLGGYVLFRLNKSLMDKAWTCNYGDSEEINNEGKTLCVQDILGYVIRYADDVAVTEAVLFALNIANQTVGEDPRVQIAIFLATDCTLRMGKYFAFTPNPIDALADDDDLADTRSYEAKVAGRMTWKVAGQLAMCGISYGLVELTCSLMPGREDNIVSRMTNLAVAASPWVLEFTGNQLAKIPAVKNCYSRVSNFCGGLFAGRRGYEPIPTENEPILTATKTINGP